MWIGTKKSSSQKTAPRRGTVGENKQDFFSAQAVSRTFSVGRFWAG
jgi:hypothetical protein